MDTVHLNWLSYASIIVLLVMYGFLISEKVNKVVVVGLASCFLIVGQIFAPAHGLNPQDQAVEFVSRNLDVLGFIVGMMVLVGIVKQSGLFEAIAIWLVKKVKGNPRGLLIVIGYLTLFMTSFLSNIPTVLILVPVLLVLIKELKLPPLPFFMTVVTMANLGGAMTPISDPTTYYQAKTVGLGFLEVVSNSGVIVLLLSVVSLIYINLVFHKDLSESKVEAADVARYNPKKAIQNKKVLFLGTPILLIVILLMIGKEYFASHFNIHLDNASVTISGALLALLLFHKDPREMYKNVIDWEILFFFAGLFIVVGSLEHNHVISALAGVLLSLTNTFHVPLQALITFGSGILSTFIDNVPYNIAMVGTIQEMAKAGVFVYPLWWGLNLGTSLGGAGSPIGAACNVLSFGQAEKDGIHIGFGKFLLVGFPLVIINALVTFAVLWIRYNGRP